jgi:ribosomal protein L37AE/L43A
MPRSNRPKRKRGQSDEVPELNLDAVRAGIKRTEIKNGVEYNVQTTTGARADDDKIWVCPHCHLNITKGIAHTVAWDAHRDISTRRHFHNACWKSFQGKLL